MELEAVDGASHDTNCLISDKVELEAGEYRAWFTRAAVNMYNSRGRIDRPGRRDRVMFPCPMDTGNIYAQSRTPGGTNDEGPS